MLNLKPIGGMRGVFILMQYAVMSPRKDQFFAIKRLINHRLYRLGQAQRIAKIQSRAMVHAV